MLMLSSDVQKLLAFAKRLEGADPEDLISICAEEGGGVITNPFGVKYWDELDDAEQLEWFVYVLFGVKVIGVSAEEASYYADRRQSRGWTLEEWYGALGDEYRTRCGLAPMPQSAKDEWHAFLEVNRNRTLDDVRVEIDALEAARVERLAKRKTAKPRRRGVAS